MRLTHILLLPLLVVAVVSCESGPMKITQIEDDYGKQHSIPQNENIFLIENFSNDIHGIISILEYTENIRSKMMPFEFGNNNCTFIFNKNDVTFDDAMYYINGKKQVLIWPNLKNAFLYDGMYISGYSTLPYTLKGTTDFFIDYDEFNLSVFQTFLDAVDKERDKMWYNSTIEAFEKDGRKVETLEQEYRLINIKTGVECTMKFIDRFIFSLSFPNHILNKTPD